MMKTKIILSLAFMFFTGLAFAQGNLPVNVSNSLINWTGHAEVGSYAPHGTLYFKSGSILVNKSEITSAILSIDMKSMKQENEHLLEHLKSDDFFDVEKYPFSTILIEKVVNGTAFGQLTIKNKTLPFQCRVNVGQGSSMITISGKVVIDRTKYGIIYNSGNFFSGLGDKAIRNTFDIDFKIEVPQPVKQS